MRPEMMDIEEARQFLSQHFGRPVDEINTEELEGLYDISMRESRESSYRETHEELLRALNLVLMNRRSE